MTFYFQAPCINSVAYLRNDRHGAEEVEPSASGGGRAGRGQAFQGRAYRLGDSEATSEVISSAARLPDHPQVQKLLLS